MPALTVAEARGLAISALDDHEGTGLPMVDRVMAAINAGADMASDFARGRSDDFEALVEHLRDQVRKRQYLNASVIAVEIQAMMIRRLGAVLKGGR